MDSCRLPAPTLQACQVHGAGTGPPLLPARGTGLVGFLQNAADQRDGQGQDLPQRATAGTRGDRRTQEL